MESNSHNNFVKSFDKCGKIEEIENKNLSDNEINIEHTNSMFKRKVNTEANSNNIIGLSKSEIKHKINGRPKTSYNFRSKKPINKSNILEEGNKSCFDSYSKINEDNNLNSKSPDFHFVDLEMRKQGGSAQKESIQKNIKVKFTLNDNSKEKQQTKIRPISINKLKNEKSKMIEALLEKPKNRLNISKFHKGLKNLGMIYLESKKRTKAKSQSKEKENPLNLNHSFL